MAMLDKITAIVNRIGGKGDTGPDNLPALAAGAKAVEIPEAKPQPVYKIKYSFDQGQRAFDAAMQSLVNYGWASDRISYDETIYANLSSLRGQARDLDNNNDYVRRYMLLLNQGVVFRGIWPEPQFRTPADDLDKTLNLQLKKAFKLWGKKGNCDVTGKLSFIDVLRISLWGMVRDGESFVRIVRGDKFGAFGFALQMIDAVQVDDQINQTLPNGNEVVMGVEKDEWDRPVAYYVRSKPRAGTLRIGVSDYVRVPAEEMIHLYRPERSHQTRGVPWLRSKNLRMLGSYLESELVASRVASHKMAFLEQTGDETEEPEADEYGNVIAESYPGGIETLPRGYKLSVFDPKHPNENFDAFVKTELRAIAAGLGVSMNSLALDLVGVSYSSLRHGTLDERDFFRTCQDLLIEGLCQPLWPKWVTNASLAKKVPIPILKVGQYLECDFVARSYPWVDPQKEMTAHESAVRLGIKTRTQIASETGRTFDEICAERASEMEIEKEYGLSSLEEQSLAKGA